MNKNNQKYGIFDKRVIILKKIGIIEGSNYYSAKLLNGGPSFWVKCASVFVPKDQTAIKILFSSKKAS